MNSFVDEHTNLIYAFVGFVVLCLLFQFYKQYTIGNDLYILKKRVKKMQIQSQNSTNTSANSPLITVDDLHLEDKTHVARNFKHNDVDSHADSYMDPTGDF